LNLWATYIAPDGVWRAMQRAGYFYFKQIRSPGLRGLSSAFSG